MPTIIVKHNNTLYYICGEKDPEHFRGIRLTKKYKINQNYKDPFILPKVECKTVQEGVSMIDIEYY